MSSFDSLLVRAEKLSFGDWIPRVNGANPTIVTLGSLGVLIPRHFVCASHKGDCFSSYWWKELG